MRQQIASVLGCFREELDDHRIAINENTGELSCAMDFLNEVNAKIDKLTERLDELTLLVKGAPKKQDFTVKPLNSREKEVFQELYCATESSPYVTYDQLARKCCLTREMVSLAVASMIRKGVPVLKRMNNNLVMLKLDSAFKEEQAKTNLVGVSSLLSYL